MNDDMLENSIDSLIEYADDDSDASEYEEDAEEFAVETAPEEEDFSDIPEIEALPDYNEADEPFDEYDEDEPLFHYSTDEKPPRKKRGAKVLGCLGTVFAVLLIAAVVLAFISIDTGIIGTYKRNFSKNFTALFGDWKTEKTRYVNDVPRVKKASRYKPDIKKSVIIPLNNTDNIVFAPYKEGIICAASNHMSYIDSSGNIVWETDTAVVEPLLAAEGNYIVLAEKGRSKLCLYSDKKLLYDVDDPDGIVAVKVSARGDTVAVTDKSSYRGGISVYNKTGEQIYSWASGSDAVISADISTASRRVAVSLLNTESNARSVIQLFDLNETQSYAQIEVPNTVMYELRFSGNTLTAFGDNRLTVISDSGRVLTDTELGNVQITHSAQDEKGNKLLAVDDGNMPMLSLYAPHGAVKESMELGGVSDYIDLDKKTVLYNIGRDIYFGKINAKNMTNYTATMDIQKLILVSDKAFVIIYSNSLEVIAV